MSFLFCGLQTIQLTLVVLADFSRSYVIGVSKCQVCWIVCRHSCRHPYNRWLMGNSRRPFTPSGKTITSYKQAFQTSVICQFWIFRAIRWSTLWLEPFVLSLFRLLYTSAYFTSIWKLLTRPDQVMDFSVPLIRLAWKGIILTQQQHPKVIQSIQSIRDETN